MRVGLVLSDGVKKCANLVEEAVSTLLPCQVESIVTDLDTFGTALDWTEVYDDSNTVGIVCSNVPLRDDGCGYALNNAWILDNCDILLCVFDGIHTEGNARVKHACNVASKRGIPHVSLYVGGPNDGLVISRLGVTQ